MADLFDMFESDLGYNQSGGSRQQHQQSSLNPFADIDLTAIQSVSVELASFNITEVVS